MREANSFRYRVEIVTFLKFDIDEHPIRLLGVISLLFLITKYLYRLKVFRVQAVINYSVGDAIDINFLMASDVRKRLSFSTTHA